MTSTGRRRSLFDSPKEVAECGRVSRVCNDILQLLHCFRQASYIDEKDCWPLLPHHTTSFYDLRSYRGWRGYPSCTARMLFMQQCKRGPSKLSWPWTGGQKQDLNLQADATCFSRMCILRNTAEDAMLEIHLILLSLCKDAAPEKYPPLTTMVTQKKTSYHNSRKFFNF